MHRLVAEKLFEAEVATVSKSVATIRRWTLREMDFPVLDCEFYDPEKLNLRVRFNCDGWNTLPPKIELLTPDGDPLTDMPGRTTGVFNGSAHPMTGKPFICMRGSREYHTHPSHVSDIWEPLRGNSSMLLGGILTQVWNAWRKEIG